MNWDYLAEGRAFYESKGFKYIDVPWFVPEEIDNLTRPKDKLPLKSILGNFVGSAEQSFLWLAQQGVISPGKYCTITPCVRMDVLDELHQNTFMKLELFHYHNHKDATPYLYSEIIDTATVFFGKILKLETTEVWANFRSSDVDIVDSIFNIELGSYGTRKIPQIHWSFGTGCAEPRTSYVYNKQREYFKGLK